MLASQELLFVVFALDVSVILLDHEDKSAVVTIRKHTQYVSSSFEDHALRAEHQHKPTKKRT